VVEWSTASELNTVGFNIFRGDTPTDPGVRVNTELIPASEDTLTGGDYQYTDEDIVPGQVYYYYLEDVSADGATNRHGPIEVQAQATMKIGWALVITLAVVISFSVMVITWIRRKNQKRGDEQDIIP